MAVILVCCFATLIPDSRTAVAGTQNRLAGVMDQSLVPMVDTGAAAGRASFLMTQSAHDHHRSPDWPIMGLLFAVRSHGLGSSSESRFTSPLRI